MTASILPAVLFLISLQRDVIDATGPVRITLALHEKSTDVQFDVTAKFFLSRAPPLNLDAPFEAYFKKIHFFIRGNKKKSDGSRSGRWIGRGGPVAWPAQSPDLTPLDFFLWGCMKEKVYQTEVASAIVKKWSVPDEKNGTIHKSTLQYKNVTNMDHKGYYDCYDFVNLPHSEYIIVEDPRDARINKSGENTFQMLKKELYLAGLNNFEEGQLDSINPELTVEEQADLLPYDQSWEFPREKLRLDSSTIFWLPPYSMAHEKFSGRGIGVSFLLLQF
ncbi:hypothetical protein ANN_26334 [Periplaneta americana]|uniref:Uncharacterized protein n=1 Tax=Periplaneta americana TaxID=6978 RepID=A0ABQ8S6F2_PERAM|nr:hypothetical protein ANN_26334 [Periplaneta americana]